MQELGSSYGAFPAHEGLWQSARDTSASLPARLAVEHCVHEARGLDVLPSTIKKFRNAGDHASADLLEQVVLPEEVSPACDVCSGLLLHAAWTPRSVSNFGVFNGPMAMPLSLCIYAYRHATPVWVEPRWHAAEYQRRSSRTERLSRAGSLTSRLSTSLCHVVDRSGSARPVHRCCGSPCMKADCPIGQDNTPAHSV